MKTADKKKRSESESLKRKQALPKCFERAAAAATAFCLSTLIAVGADPLDEWTWRNPSPTLENFQAITYANGTFVAVGNLGTVFTSTNGIDWAQRSLPGISNNGFDHFLFGVAYGDGKFVAMGFSYDDAFYSSNGEDWTRFKRNPLFDLGHVLGVTYDNSLFVAVARFGHIYTSTNGMVWANHSLLTGSPDLSAVAFGAGRWTAVAQSGQTRMALS